MMSDTRENPGIAGGVADGDELVCGCLDLGRAAATRYLRDRPALRFDEFLDSTGAGSRCTACMLDLEYLYTQVRQEGGATAHETATGLRSGKKQPWKYRLYAFLDRVSPPVAQRMTHMLPVLKGGALDEVLWIANHALDFAKDGDVPEWRIDLTVRDSEGRVTHSERRHLAPREVLSMRVSDHLPSPKGGAAGLAAGSVEVTRLARSSGWRGTTRPQIELLTPRASSTVHGQGVQNKGEIWIPCLVRPSHERLMLVTVNCGGAPLRMVYDFPREADTAETEVTVPAHGAHVHELRLPPSSDERLIDVRYRGDGPKVVHLLSATPGLERVSIDHV